MRGLVEFPHDVVYPPQIRTTGNAQVVGIRHEWAANWQKDVLLERVLGHLNRRDLYCHPSEDLSNLYAVPAHWWSWPRREKAEHS